MITIIAVLGKTCSGKTTVVKKLVEEYGFKQIVTYTTRPIRDGEVQGETYNFVTDDFFKKGIEDGFFAEYKSFNTVEGVWYYGTSLESLENADDNTIIIVEPHGFRELCEKLENKPIAYYIYCDNDVIKERLISRGDKEDEAKRRLERDNEDFKGLEYEVVKMFYNNKDTDINDLAFNIMYYTKTLRLFKRK